MGPDIEKKIQEAHQEFLQWKKTSLGTRKNIFLKLAQNIRIHSLKLSQTIVSEMGKHIEEAKAEVEKSAQACEYVANHLELFLKPQEVNIHNQKNKIVIQPMGIILGIMPWNFPVWQTIRFALPALAVGNIALLKSSELTEGVGRLLGEIFAESGGSYQLLHNISINDVIIAKEDSEISAVMAEMVAEIIAHRLIRGVSFTGSTRVGKIIGELAGKNLKKSVLELGGSDAYIILDDVHLEETVRMCVKARMQNNGQSCIAGKRFIVKKEIYPEFIKSFCKAMGSEAARPLAHHKFQSLVQSQVDEVIQRGGRCLLGGHVEASRGLDTLGATSNAYPPTVIAIDKYISYFGEIEIFGPVALVISCEDEAHAIDIANDCIYGLGGAVFCADLNRAEEVALQINSGMVAINDFLKSDPALPFGGVKDSGYGRESGSFGILEFVNIKCIRIK